MYNIDFHVSKKLEFIYFFYLTIFKHFLSNRTDYSCLSILSLVYSSRHMYESFDFEMD